MTHDAYERGERLTIHNATKDQLKWMVKDREATIQRQYEEIERLKDEKTKLLDSLVEYVTKKGVA